MRILIAEDDPVCRRLLEADLRKWGHDVLAVTDGAAALTAMQEVDAPRLAIVDWMMPGLDGVEFCRRVRALPCGRARHLMLLTARTASVDVVAALEAGADDYVTKPFDAAELRARVGVGARMLDLQRELSGRVGELEAALAQVHRLEGILPICSYCKKVRRNSDSWQQIEAYVNEHSAARFSHGVCPECVESVVRPQIAAWRRGMGTEGAKE